MVDKHYVDATCYNEAAEHNREEDHILQALPCCTRSFGPATRSASQRDNQNGPDTIINSRNTCWQRYYIGTKMPSSAVQAKSWHKILTPIICSSQSQMV